MQPRQALAVEARRQSHPLSEGGRDLAASRYAPVDHTSTSVAEALGTLSLSTLGRPRGSNATNTSRRGAQDENTNPRHANLTSNSTERPMARGSSRVPAAPYKPISSTRRPAGVGFNVQPPQLLTLAATQVLIHRAGLQQTPDFDRSRLRFSFIGLAVCLFENTLASRSLVTEKLASRDYIYPFLAFSTFCYLQNHKKVWLHLILTWIP
jgi:hypothetical protein